MKFILTIESEDNLTRDDLQHMLQNTLLQVDEFLVFEGKIRDYNDNVVGSWKLTDCPEHNPDTDQFEGCIPESQRNLCPA